MVLFNLEDKTKMIQLICLLFCRHCCVFTVIKCSKMYWSQREKVLICQEKGLSGVRFESMKSLDLWAAHIYVKVDWKQGNVGTARCRGEFKRAVVCGETAQESSYKTNRWAKDHPNEKENKWHIHLFTRCVLSLRFAFMQRVFAVLTTKPTTECLCVDKPAGCITHRHISEVKPMKQCQVSLLKTQQIAPIKGCLPEGGKNGSVAQPASSLDKHLSKVINCYCNDSMFQNLEKAALWCLCSSF